MWVLGVLAATEVSLFLDSVCRKSLEICLYANPGIYTRVLYLLL